MLSRKITYIRLSTPLEVLLRVESFGTRLWIGAGNDSLDGKSIIFLLDGKLRLSKPHFLTFLSISPFLKIPESVMTEIEASKTIFMERSISF